VTHELGGVFYLLVHICKIIVWGITVVFIENKIKYIT